MSTVSSIRARIIFVRIISVSIFLSLRCIRCGILLIGLTGIWISIATILAIHGCALGTARSWRTFR